MVATFQLRARARPAPRCWSAPTRPPSGSVSGGCVEGAVYELGQEVVASGTPVLQRYGVSDDDAFAVGLTCGGILDVYVEKVSRETFPELGEIAADVARRPPGRAGDRHRAPRPGLAGPPRGDPPRRRAGRVQASLGSAARRRRRARRRPGPAGQRHQRDPDLRPRRRAPRRGHAGLRVGLRAPSRGCWSSAPSTSPRRWPGSGRSWATTSRSATRGPSSPPPAGFPEADEVVVDWPHRYLTAEQEAGRIDTRTIITVLTHDPKFDVPLLEVALRLPEVGLRRRDGLAAHPRGPAGRLREAGLTRTSWPGSPARSGSTSAPARPRRPRSASPRSSSPAAGAAAASGWPRRRAASTADPAGPRTRNRTADSRRGRRRRVQLRGAARLLASRCAGDTSETAHPAVCPGECPRGSELPLRRRQHGRGDLGPSCATPALRRGLLPRCAPELRRRPVVRGVPGRGPGALSMVSPGTGTFVETDEVGHRFVVGCVPTTCTAWVTRRRASASCSPTPTTARRAPRVGHRGRVPGWHGEPSRPAGGPGARQPPARDQFADRSRTT